MVVQLSIPVGNVDSLLGLGYTRIEIHQSTDSANSYQEVTAPVAAAALLDSLDAVTTFQMGGKLLKLAVDGASEVSIDFSSVVESWTPTQVANRINEVIPGRASVVGNKVRLTGAVLGRGGKLEVTYNDALDLGWEAGQVVFGKAARITLVSGTLIYTFPDVAGHNTDLYKWRFSANGNLPVSDFSTPVSGQTQPLIASGLMSIGTAYFYGPDGRPSKTRVIVAVDSTPQNIGGNFVSSSQPLLFDTDVDGFLQMTLMRGVKLRVAVEGTAFIRDFVVPNAPSFDLLTVMASAVDTFQVQTSPALLTRRSI